MSIATCSWKEEGLFSSATSCLEDGDAKEPADYRVGTTIIPFHSIPECTAPREEVMDTRPTRSGFRTHNLTNEKLDALPIGCLVGSRSLQAHLWS